MNGNKGGKTGSKAATNFLKERVKKTTNVGGEKKDSLVLKKKKLKSQKGKRKEGGGGGIGPQNQKKKAIQVGRSRTKLIGRGSEKKNQGGEGGKEPGVQVRADTLWKGHGKTWGKKLNKMRVWKKCIRRSRKALTRGRNKNRLKGWWKETPRFLRYRPQGNRKRKKKKKKQRGIRVWKVAKSLA